jgi:hypothetical protein
MIDYKRPVTLEKFLSAPTEVVKDLVYPDFPVGVEVRLVDGTCGDLKKIKGSGSSAVFEITSDKGLRHVTARNIEEIKDVHSQQELQKLKKLLG